MYLLLVSTWQELKSNGAILFFVVYRNTHLSAAVARNKCRSTYGLTSLVAFLRLSTFRKCESPRTEKLVEQENGNYANYYRESTGSQLVFCARKRYTPVKTECQSLSPPAFEILVVRAPGTTKKCCRTTKMLPDNQKYWCNCPTDNRKCVAPL